MSVFLENLEALETIEVKDPNGTTKEQPRNLLFPLRLRYHPRRPRIFVDVFSSLSSKAVNFTAGRRSRRGRFVPPAIKLYQTTSF